MKNLLFLFLMSIILFSCGSNDSKEEVVYQSERDTALVAANPDTSVKIINDKIFWSVQPNAQNEKRELKKPATVAISKFAPQQLVDSINNIFPGMQLVFNKISHDTLYVRMPQSARLTNNIGDTGAENYLATVVYNLTELPGIKYVNLFFTPGDHAEPGVYSRDDFKKMQ
ncbi:MAG: GerMN domain-containing protein [Ferruginibacter sp.]